MATGLTSWDENPFSLSKGCHAVEEENLCSSIATTASTTPDSSPGAHPAVPSLFLEDEDDEECSSLSSDDEEEFCHRAISDFEGETDSEEEDDRNTWLEVLTLAPAYGGAGMPADEVAQHRSSARKVELALYANGAATPGTPRSLGEPGPILLYLQRWTSEGAAAVRAEHVALR